MSSYRYEWRGEFADDELNALHAEAFDHPMLDHGWHDQVRRHSLGWVTARQGAGLVGFVNVPWDGDTHAFILDTIVGARHRRQGIGKQLVGVAVDEARSAGCEWLHVDFEDDVAGFYLGACRFKATRAGLIDLQNR